MASQPDTIISKEEALKLIEECGNIKTLEHINLSNVEKCTEQAPVYTFYMKGLQCSRDPRLSYHFWANFGGRHQFHLFTSQKENECINGSIYLYVPDLDAIESSLESVKEELKDTKFAFERINRGGLTTIDYPREKWQELFDVSKYDHIKANDPYGNEFRLSVTPRHYKAVSAALGGELPYEGGRPAVPEGFPFVAYPVRPGVAKGIARYFEHYLGAKTVVTRQETSSPDDTNELFTTHVFCGPLQAVVFIESEAQKDSKGEYDGHHLCIYIDRFEELYHVAYNEKMNHNNYLFFDRCDTWEDAKRDQQYRILNCIDPLDKSFLWSLELEIRSAQHFRYLHHRTDLTPEEEAENDAKRKKNL
ncbi:hypothetical protein Poli38472_006891 [Pythium oligandrum]|uniref:Uncharacterized protein n=1 Tax=Pythium oligandrum TaxID=41045 RepID=A0A8K1FC74_PYTOL|nr:hypothetical protein Poli38472_006891 [Pythium oligandrum]|eukprot:TMW56881.1 hypothetical protein Poli38472_006891 [Pythium oligandrum]